MSNKSKIVFRATQTILILVVIVFACAGFYFYHQTRQESEARQGVIDEYTTQDAQNDVEADDNSVSTPDKTTESDVVLDEYDIGADFAALKAVNDDVVAWVSIPGTAINYPVVQGEDNNAYLSLGWDGERIRGGASFMDFRTDIQTAECYIIYGHSMGYESDAMFANLLKYKEASQLEESPYVYLSFANDPIASKQVANGTAQPDGQYRFHIIGICEVDTGKEDDIEKFYWFEADDKGAVGEYINIVQERSMHDVELQGTPCKILSLSTCSRPGSGSNMKLVVTGVLYKENFEMPFEINKEAA